MSSTPVVRSRSPRFPSYPLTDAIEYAERIYAGVHRSSIDSTTAYRLMGFAGKSGASATALGSVRQFGLVEGVGNSTRISNLGLRILEPVTAEERNQAVTEAAQKPEVFREILQRFDGSVPTADEPVRAFLIRELGFSKVGAEDCLASLRTTLEMVKGTAVEFHPTNLDQGQPARSAMALAESQTQEAPSQEFMRIPLTRDCSVELRFIGHVTEKAISNLMRHIELTKEIWQED